MKPTSQTPPDNRKLARIHRADLIRRAVSLGYAGPKNKPNFDYSDYIRKHVRTTAPCHRLFARAKELGFLGAYNTTKSAQLRAYIDQIESEQQQPAEKKRRLVRPSASAAAHKQEEKKEENKESVKSDPRDFNQEYQQEHLNVNKLISAHGDIKQHAPLIKQLVQQQIDTPAAGHAIEMRFAVEYDFMDLSIQLIGMDLTRMVCEHVLAHWPHFSLKLLIYGDLVNTTTGERIVDFPWPFPRDSTFTIRTQTDIRRLAKQLLSFLKHFRKTDEIYPSTRWKYDFISGFGFKLFHHEVGGCRDFKLPPPLCFGRACKNPDNVDDLCFWRCVAIRLYSAAHPGIRKKNSKVQREKAQQLRDRADWKTDHVALVDVPLLARELGLDIQTFTVDGGGTLTSEWADASGELELNPGGKALDSPCTEPIMLLWCPPVGQEQRKGHYVLINTQIGVGTGIKCRNCGLVLKHGVNASRTLARHARRHHNEQTRSPQQLQFRSGAIRPKLSVLTTILGIPIACCDLYIAYDFESLLVKQTYRKEATSSVQYTQRHEPIGVVAKAHCPDAGDLKLDDLSYTGTDAGRRFVRHLDQIAPQIRRWKLKQLWRKYNPQLQQLQTDHCRCQSATFLHTGYCSTASGETKESSCSGCRVRKKHGKGCGYLKRKARVESEYCRVPVVGFNSGRYDMTFVVNAMNDSAGEIKSVINKGSGYMSLRYDIYEFVDARNYVPPNVSLSKFAEMWGVRSLEKGEFPYSWLDAEQKLSATEFPTREHFYNDLSQQELPQDRYDAANAFFDENCSTMGEYMMLYCEKDVDLLIRGLNNYRQLVRADMHVELLDYISLPQFVYASLLSRYIDTQRHPITYTPDERSFRIINDSCYGGGCQVFTRHAKVEREDELIVSVDENNLYGHSMCHLLPYGDPVAFHSMDQRCRQMTETFRRVSAQARTQDVKSRYSFLALHNIENNTPPADPYGFDGFMRVHLSFTEAQKQRVRYFPPLPEKRRVSEAELGEYMTQVKREIERDMSQIFTQWAGGQAGEEEKGEEKQEEQTRNYKKTNDSPKLVYDLHDKQSDAIYSVFLKFLLENDLCQLDAVYELCEMRVGYVMRDFVQRMTAQRQQAENDIRSAQQAYTDATTDDERAAAKGAASRASSQKTLKKLVVNSSFGKTIQSDEKFHDSALVRTAADFRRRVVGRVHIDSTIIGPRLVEVKTRKRRVTIKAPKYIGAAVFANSKMLMLDYIYNCLWSPESDFDPATANILYTDTDSLYMKITGVSGTTCEQRFHSFLARLDPEQKERHHCTRPDDLTVGKMKVEHFIQEAVFVKPKTYAFREDHGQQNNNNNNGSTAEEVHNKGVILHQNREAMRFDNYKRAVLHNRIQLVKNTLIRKDKRLGGVVSMRTQQLTKIGLDSFCDKRRMLDAVHSEPYGLLLHDHKQPPASVDTRLVNNMRARADKYGIPWDEKLLGGVVETKRHLEQKFTVGMCWRNYGSVWAVDHVLPISVLEKHATHASSKNGVVHICRKLVHFTNLQPLFHADNSRKKDKLTSEQLEFVTRTLRP